MFVDASALTAMLTDEADARELLARAQNYPLRFTSPLTVWETVIAVARVLGIEVRNAASAVEDFLVLTEIEVRLVPAEVRRLAIEAFDRFGKGRHPAARISGTASPMHARALRVRRCSTKATISRRPTLKRLDR